MSTGTFQYDIGATPIDGEFADWVREQAGDAGEIRFDYTTQGPWSRIKSLRGLVISHPDGRDEWGHVKGRIVFHGERSMSNPREEGYGMRGRVSIDGKTRRAFTSSTMVKLPEGKLVNIAVLYVSV